MAGMLGTGPAHRQSGAGVTVRAHARPALREGGGRRGFLTLEQELEVSRVPTGQAGPRPMPHNRTKLLTIYLALDLQQNVGFFLFCFFPVADFVDIPSTGISVALDVAQWRETQHG